MCQHNEILRTLTAKPPSCPFHAAAKPELAFTPMLMLIDALPGFMPRDNRSETLNGGILARSRTCKPFTGGNKTGLHPLEAEVACLSPAAGCSIHSFNDPATSRCGSSSQFLL